MQPADFDREELLRFLGTPTLDAQLSAKLEHCLQTLCQQMQPRQVYRIFPLIWRDSVPYLEETPLEGKDIAAHLQGCTQAAVMAVTLSASVDALIRSVQARDMAEAVMLDTAAGSAVEYYCEQTEQEICQRIELPYHTERFSAGYGDFPLSIQGTLLQMLNAQRIIGLTVTSSNLLLPMKSVTAIIGFSSHPTQDARRFGCGKSCALCPQRDDCPYQQKTDREDNI